MSPYPSEITVTGHEARNVLLRWWVEYRRTPAPIRDGGRWVVARRFCVYRCLRPEGLRDVLSALIEYFSTLPSSILQRNRKWTSGIGRETRQFIFYTGTIQDGCFRDTEKLYVYKSVSFIYLQRRKSLDPLLVSVGSGVGVMAKGKEKDKILFL